MAVKTATRTRSPRKPRLSKHTTAEQAKAESFLDEAESLDDTPAEEEPAEAPETASESVPSPLPAMEPAPEPEPIPEPVPEPPKPVKVDQPTLEEMRRQLEAEIRAQLAKEQEEEERKKKPWLQPEANYGKVQLNVMVPTKVKLMLDHYCIHNRAKRLKLTEVLPEILREWVEARFQEQNWPIN